MVWTQATIGSTQSYIGQIANCGSGKLLAACGIQESPESDTHPSIIVSIDYGSSWALQYSDSSVVGVMSGLSTDGPVLLASEGVDTGGTGKILRWNSNTSTWDAVYTGTSGSGIGKPIWIGGTTYLAIDFAAGLIKSTASGDSESWSVVDGSITDGFLASDGNGTVLWVWTDGTNPTVKKSINAGTSWTLVLTISGLAYAYPSFVRHYPTLETPIFLCGAGDGNSISQIWKSTDGNSWSQVGGDVSEPYIYDVDIDAANPTKWYAAAVTTSLIYESDNSGGSWTSIAITSLENINFDTVSCILDGSNVSRPLVGGYSGATGAIILYSSSSENLPTFTSITPATGPKAGGVPVLIEGTNFTGVTAVAFGGTAAASFTVLSDTQIVAFTPAHAAGAVDVVVTSPTGTGTGTNAYIYTDDTSAIIDTTIEEGIDDAMSEATFRYDSTGVGLSDGDYLTNVTISMRDKAGTSYVKFVGVCVNGDGNFGLADDKIALTAFDYRFFLSNTVDEGDLALLPADQQGTAKFGRTLSYKSSAIAFTVGLRIYGGTSKANGRIMAIDYNTHTLTLYPAFGEFVDSEEIHVGGTLYAYADGRSVDIPYSTYLGTIYPEDWILRLLGGSSGWSTTTGIYPFKIVPTTHDSNAIWDTDPVTSKVYYARVFTFTEERKLKEVIAEVTKYLRRIYHAKPVLVSGTWYCGFYWVRQSQIDDATYGLDLPAALTITAGSSDGDLDDSNISLVASGEDRIQKVHVWSETLWGDRIDAYYPSTYFSILGKDYSKRHSEITTQSDLEDLALDVFNAKSTLSRTWTATLIERPDIEKYQKLVLSGYGPQVPDGTYRIIRVRYTDGLATNKTQIWFINNDAFLSQMRLGWTYQDSIKQTVDLVNYLNSQEVKNEKIQFVSQNTDGSWNVITADGKPDILPAWSNE